MKKIIAFSLVFVFTLSLGCTAFAVEPPLTDEEVQQAVITNKLVEEYLASKPMLFSSGGKNLQVPLYQQETNYYCGVASAQMILAYQGNSVSQTTIANYVDASSMNSEKILRALNHYGTSGIYQVTSTSTGSILGNDLVYSIDHNAPLVCAVKEMPEYYSQFGHFIVLTGYSYGSSGSMSQSTVYYNDPHWNDDFFGRWSMSLNEMKKANDSNGGRYIRYAK